MYKWIFRFAVAAVITFLGWQWLSARTQRDVAIERANGNFALAEIAQKRLDEANTQILDEISRSNDIVQAMADAAKMQRDMNAPRIEALTRLSGVWADRANRMVIPRSESCEARLQSMDAFVTNYLMEVNSAARP